VRFSSANRTPQTSIQLDPTEGSVYQPSAPLEVDIAIADRWPTRGSVGVGGRNGNGCRSCT
jgi:hypothetical protein